MGKGRTKYGKPDANHKDVMNALEELPFVTVIDLKAVGEGCPDLLVGISQRNYLVEVKDGKKPPSARKFTPAQVEFQRTWKGAWHVVLSAKEAQDWAISMRTGSGPAVVSVPVVGVIK